MVDGQGFLFDVRGRLCERNPDPGSTSTVLECGHAGLVVNQLCLLEQVAEYHLLLSLGPGDVIEVTPCTLLSTPCTPHPAGGGGGEEGGGGGGKGGGQGRGLGRATG